MSPRERVDAALELAREAFTRLRDWEEEPDPVAQRRLQVEAAIYYRHAADLLDDQRRLTL